MPNGAPAEITCLFGTVGNVAVPSDPADWRYQSLTLSEVFGAASKGAIKLSTLSRTEKTFPPQGTPPTALDLHRALAQLTAQSGSPPPIRKIGVLFATSYAGQRETLGLMFARGFSTPDDENAEFMATPREGCAIFVDSIQELWKKDPASVQKELQFTTAHELGHVFNLEHVEETANFMQSSDGESPYGEEHYHFTAPHIDFLRQCPTQRCIHPGGTKYGDRADLGASFDPAQSGNAVSRRCSALRLRLAVPVPSIWYCEPAEMEISLSLPIHAPGPALFPDRVDPGYGEFVIWIEEPHGERRRYRSPKFFCGRLPARSIQSGETFRRDISIFGESGGYTFRRSGVHKLWAEFRLSARLKLVSNFVEIELRSRHEGGRAWERTEPLLRRHAGLLYYRSTRDLKTATEGVKAICRAAGTSPTAAVARYALGRAQAQQAMRSSPAHGRRHAARARQHLEMALATGRLGSHSASRAQAALEDLSAFFGFT